jgi:hypothetical protein
MRNNIISGTDLVADRCGTSLTPRPAGRAQGAAELRIAAATLEYTSGAVKRSRRISQVQGVERQGKCSFHQSEMEVPVTGIAQGD